MFENRHNQIYSFMKMRGKKYLRTMKKKSLLSGTNFKYDEFSKLFPHVTKTYLQLTFDRAALISMFSVA